MSVGELWDVVSLGRARRRRQVARLVRSHQASDSARSTVRRRSLLFAVVWLVMILVVPRALDRLVSHPSGVGPSQPYTGSYRFLQYEPGRPGTPVTYSPCRPIHVVVNDDLAPPSGQGMLADALVRMHRATGLVFALDGHSDQLPTFGGSTWNRVDRPPVLIGWTTPEADHRLDGGAAGVGGSSASGLGSQRFYVTGEIALDAPQLTEMLDHHDGEAWVEGVLVHELSHVVGLAHVDDPRENMNPHGRRDGRLGLGDRKGLARLGEGPCLG